MQIVAVDEGRAQPDGQLFTTSRFPAVQPSFSILRSGKGSKPKSLSLSPATRCAHENDERWPDVLARLGGIMVRRVLDCDLWLDHGGCCWERTPPWMLAPRLRRTMGGGETGLGVPPRTPRWPTLEKIRSQSDCASSLWSGVILSNSIPNAFVKIVGLSSASRLLTRALGTALGASLMMLLALENLDHL